MKKKSSAGNARDARKKAFSPSVIFGAAGATDLFRDKEKD